MKKSCRIITFVFDTLFWYLLYLLPVVLYLLQGSGLVVDFFSSVGFSFSDSNIVYNSLLSLFGISGVLPLFGSSTVLWCASWFVCVFLVHLAVDFLLFIPRLCHKWIGKVVKDEE